MTLRQTQTDIYTSCLQIVMCKTRELELKQYEYYYGPQPGLKSEHLALVVRRLNLKKHIRTQARKYNKMLQKR